MALQGVIAISVIASITGCSGHHEVRAKRKLHERYLGIYIDHEPRTGTYYKSHSGKTYFYNSVQTTITNDTSVSISIGLSVAKGYYEAVPHNGKMFKLFLLPGPLTIGGRSGTNGVNPDLQDLVEGNAEQATTFNRILGPQQECTLNIGFLADTTMALGAEVALFSKGHHPHYPPLSDDFYTFPDSALNRVTNGPDDLAVFLGIHFDPIPSDTVRYYSIIPCGHISF